MTEPRKISAGGVWTEYSSVNPWSHLNEWLLLVHLDHFGLYHGDGRFAFDTTLRADSEPRWSLRENCVYYLLGNQLRKWHVIGADSLVETFPQYAAVSGKGEADISEDGDHLVLCGENRCVFTYQISTRRVGTPLDLYQNRLDSIYVTPENSVLVSWLSGGRARYQGIELFDRDMNFLRQVAPVGGHMDVGRNALGEECLYWCNSNDPAPIAPNAVVEIRLRDGQQRPLLSLPWSEAMHICAVPGYVFVDSYANPEGGAIHRINLATGHSDVLALHGSRATEYTNQPRVVASRDGSRIAWTSNKDGETAVYLMDLAATATAEPAPTIDGAVVRGGQDVELYGEFPPDVTAEVTYRGKKQVNVRLKK